MFCFVLMCSLFFLCLGWLHFKERLNFSNVKILCWVYEHNLKIYSKLEMHCKKLSSRIKTLTLSFMYVWRRHCQVQTGTVTSDEITLTNVEFVLYLFMIFLFILLAWWIFKDIRIYKNKFAVDKSLYMYFFIYIKEWR